MFRGAMSNKNEVVRQAQSRRQVLYLLSAGVAEMETYSHVRGKWTPQSTSPWSRVAELWQFARAAVADGRIRWLRSLASNSPEGENIRRHV